jgi:hypothetical protein
MVRSLTQINDHYEQVLNLNLNECDKDIEYARLMNEIESDYKVPMIRNEGWENKNKKVISLYRKISISRSI